jgi:hypothetical protein
MSRFDRDVEESVLVTAKTEAQQLSLPKMLSVANAFKISDHQCNRANPAIGCSRKTAVHAGLNSRKTTG